MTLTRFAPSSEEPGTAFARRRGTSRTVNPPAPSECQTKAWAAPALRLVTSIVSATMNAE